eukprot:g6767.t1
MTSGILRNNFSTSCVVHPTGSRLTSVTSRSSFLKTDMRLERSPPFARSKIGRLVILPHRLTSGSSTGAPKPAASTPRAVVLEDEEAPQPETVVLNGVTDDWAASHSSRDWDGKEVTESAKSLPALAGIVAVLGAGYFCTRLVGTLMNRRTEVAKIVSYPITFTRGATSTQQTPVKEPEVGTPAPPVQTEVAEVAESPVVELDVHEEDIPVMVEETLEDLTEAEVVVDIIEQEEEEDPSMAVSDESLDSTLTEQLEESEPPVVTLPEELTEGNLRERAQMIIRTANAATEAAQRATAFSASASNAATTAARASKDAMIAAALAHVAMESGDLEKMALAQNEAWKATHLAAEAERMAAEAAIEATKHEEDVAQQAEAAGELSMLPTGGILRAFMKKIQDTVDKIISPIVKFTTQVRDWVTGVYTYFASGAFVGEVKAFALKCVTYVQGLIVSMFEAVKNAFFKTCELAVQLCIKACNGVKYGVISFINSLKEFAVKIWNHKGTVSGGSSAC